MFLYHEPTSLGLGEGEKGRCIGMCPSWDILDNGPPMPPPPPPFMMRLWVCWDKGIVVGGLPAVDVVITSLDDCDVDEDVEFNRFGEWIRIRNGDTCGGKCCWCCCCCCCCCCWCRWWCWFKWCCKSVWELPFDCPLATQAATIAAIAAFCGSWGWGRIRTGRWCGGGWFCTLPIVVFDDDGAMPIGGECVAFIGDELSPKR